MKINNIDVKKANQFIGEVKRDLSLAKKSKKIVGRYTHSSLESKRDAVENLVRIWHSRDPIYVDSDLKSVS